MTVFEIGAKLGLDAKGFNKALGAASQSVSSFASKTKEIMGTAAKTATAALGAASAGIAAFTKQAVTAYADYEQLVGGVETLFGDAAETIKKNADNAFKSAGLTVNEYMETSIQSAAALINSLEGDQKKAAELMDMSITDMADNVNKMGTSMEGVQNAYRGFSRGNYTMLDNLALGFAGTKEGMQELLDKAQELAGVEYDIESYSDIVEAIHVVQTEMGITGTTAKEAASTISGSVATMKSAWKNLVIEVGKDDGDIATAFNNLQESVATVAQNVLPRVQQVLTNVGQLITQSAPQITTAITKLLPKILPAVIKSAGQLVSGVGSSLISAMPDLFEAGRNLMANLAYGLENSEFEGSGILENVLDSIVSNAPYYFQYAQMIVTNLANKLLDVDYGKLASNLSTLFVDAVNSITDFVKSIDFYKVGENIADFLNNIDWQTVANSLFDLLAAGIKAIPDIAVSFFSNADLGNLMTMIGLMGAPKLLGGITDFTGGEEGQELGKAAGQSWSGAFMAGVKAFGLGWALGTYIRDELVEKYGEEKVNDVIGGGAFGVLGLSQEMKVAQEKANSYTYTNKYGQKVTIPMYDENANYTEAYKKVAMQGPPLPKFGNGGRVTRPTLAIVGEKEPETMVPDSKRGQFGNTYNISINVEGYSIKNDEEFTELLSQKLAELSVRQQRAQGGTAW